ncbi:MAG: DUF116 domain-containing protein [bacterium]|nr:DUF116 domain-containing protein [bacterium]
MQLVSFIFPKRREPWQALFIKLNNTLLFPLIKNLPLNPKILILLPHCLQFDDCVFRITKSIKNCASCGKCVIKDFVDIQDKTKIPVAVATGGTLARKAIREERPDFVVACACERDLATGIYDAYPFMVYGILNKRPNGPCVNTTLDIKEFEAVLEKLS